MDELLKDMRFAHVAKDPKFRRIPKAERKVKIDKRFQSMLQDKKFTVKYTVDKRGRSINQTTTENLKKYYDLSSSDEDESKEDAPASSSNKKIEKEKEIDNIKHKKVKNKKKIATEEVLSDAEDISNNENESEKSDNNYFSSNKNLFQVSQLDLDENEKQLLKKRKSSDGKVTDKVRYKLKDLNVNYARGEGTLFTDSSSSEEFSEASDNEEEIEHNWGDLNKEIETTDNVTHRLAICDMDWDRIRAVDLMVLLNSFLPTNGAVRSVTIYPSEFGLQRMQEEELNGPKELRNDNIQNDDENEDDENEDDVNEDDINEDDINEDDNEEGTNYHMEKLRQYQLNRLKYYYAVAEFDSAETANKVYTDCDGIEYESSATKLDLRFIPDDMTFDQEPKEMCNKVPQLTKYEPRQFITTALQQVKVSLTWDETNPDREEFAQKLNSGQLQNIDENDLQMYLASGSEDDSNEDPEENKIVTNEVNDNLNCETNNDAIVKYKSLLKSIERDEETNKKKDVELEFTWGIDTKEKVEKLVKERAKNNEKLTPFEQYLEKRKMKKKAKKEEKKEFKDNSDSKDFISSDTDMNDEYFDEKFKNSKLLPDRQKKNNRNKIDLSDEQEENRSKAELELLLMDQDKDDGKKHFNMKEIEENATLSKSKRKRRNKKKDAEEKTKEDDFEVDIEDPRFSAVLTSHHFNIDPTDPHYRKTKGTETLINEKLKRKNGNKASVEDERQSKKSKTDVKLSTELQALVKSVKRKTHNIQPIKKL